MRKVIIVAGLLGFSEAQAMMDQHYDTREELCSQIITTALIDQSNAKAQALNLMKEDNMSWFQFSLLAAASESLVWFRNLNDEEVYKEWLVDVLECSRQSHPNEYHYQTTSDKPSSNNTETE